LYFQTLQLRQLQECDAGDDEGDYNEYGELVGQEDRSLVELWILGDKFSMPRLQNLVLDVIDQISLKGNKIATGALHYLYKSTAADSRLRAYHVALCSSKLGSFLKVKGHFPREMLVELVNHFITRYIQANKEISLSDYYIPEER